MFLAEVRCMFLFFIAHISGAQGQKKQVCALKGSSVELLCSPRFSFGSPTSSSKWYTVHWNNTMFVQNEVSADGNRVTYNMSEENRPTLMINDLRESDGKSYCCRDMAKNPELCSVRRIELHVADLQVMVIPATEDQTVTLMCSTSCPLTENPAAYVWYKNREFLYEDWSPWYQELVSSDEAATYSCAVKGYEDLRAPEVSVDSITSTCFKVTYAKGQMCSHQQKSVNESCSITYPREVLVERMTVGAPGYLKLTCSTNCPLTEPQTANTLYQNRCKYWLSRVLVSNSSNNSFTCAVEDIKYLHSSDICVEDKNCWTVNYVRKRICALEGFSVNISSEYTHPENQWPKFKFWYKKRSSEEKSEKLTEDDVEYRDNKNHHILTINNLKKNHSAEYSFRLQEYNEDCKWSELPGVTLVVTGLEVKFRPSPEVTEGDRVTLTCSTSCPLTDNTNYIWYMNGRPLTLPENQNKHLILDPVSSQHAGNYSCGVKTNKNKRSTVKTLTVQSSSRYSAVAAGVTAVLLVLIPLTVFCWIRSKRTYSLSSRTETSDKTEELKSGPVNDDGSARQTEHDDLHYSQVHFSKSKTDPSSSTIQPHQPRDQEKVLYAAVKVRNNL